MIDVSFELISATRDCMIADYLRLSVQFRGNCFFLCIPDGRNMPQLSFWDGFTTALAQDQVFFCPKEQIFSACLLRPLCIAGKPSIQQSSYLLAGIQTQYVWSSNCVFCMLRNGKMCISAVKLDLNAGKQKDKKKRSDVLSIRMF